MEERIVSKAMPNFGGFGLVLESGITLKITVPPAGLQIALLNGGLH
jgi:hypothetical protein